jgi:hypothetical protein
MAIRKDEFKKLMLMRKAGEVYEEDDIFLTSEGIRSLKTKHTSLMVRD